jgi:hypothetical protein
MKMHAVKVLAASAALATIMGVAAAVAQAPELPPAGGGEYLPPPTPNQPMTRGQGSAVPAPLPPAGGGEYLPPPMPKEQPTTGGRGASVPAPLPPAGGGQFLPPPSR